MSHRLLAKVGLHRTGEFCHAAQRGLHDRIDRHTIPDLGETGAVGLGQQIHDLTLPASERTGDRNRPADVTVVMIDVAADVETHQFTIDQDPIKVAIVMRELMVGLGKHGVRSSHHPRPEVRSLTTCLHACGEDQSLNSTLPPTWRDSPDAALERCVAGCGRTALLNMVLCSA